MLFQNKIDLEKVKSRHVLQVAVFNGLVDKGTQKKKGYGVTFIKLTLEAETVSFCCGVMK